MKYQFAIAHMGLFGVKGREVNHRQMRNKFLLKALPGSEEFCKLEDVSVLDGVSRRLTADVFQLSILPMPVFWGGYVSLNTGENVYYSELGNEIADRGFEVCLEPHKQAVLDVLRQTLDYRNFHQIHEGKENWNYAPYQVEAMVVFGYEFIMGDMNTPDAYQFTVLGEWDHAVQPALVSQAQLPEEVQA